MQSVAELNQLRELGIAEILDCSKEAGQQHPALHLGAMLAEQQVTELLLEPVDRFQRWKHGEVGRQFGPLLGSEVVAVAPHQRKQSPILRTSRIDLAPAGQEV